MERIKALDGLRGLAVLLVVVSHLFARPNHGIELFDVGWLGVEIFFVLSGFLIGSIILKEHDEPGFVLRFYARRAARILPAYWMMLLFSFLIVTPLVHDEKAYPPVIYLTFAQNIVTAFKTHRDVFWTQPLWTLGIEEQFYLVTPLVLMLTPRRWALAALIAIWAGSGVFRLVAFCAGVDPSDTLFLLPARADLLGAGVIAAWVYRRGVPARALSALRIAPSACFVAGAALFVFGRAVFADFHETFFSIGLAAFVLALVSGAPEARGLLEAPAMTYLGRISYSLYLIHVPIDCALHYGLLSSTPGIATPAQIGVTALAGALSVGAAAASWRWMERPIIDSVRQRLVTAWRANTNPRTKRAALPKLR
jgi:peptidoglycan/LPS O-acetylase OafA/YrhL